MKIQYRRGRRLRAALTFALCLNALGDLSAQTSGPEFGHGLDAKSAAEGWISLFDGASTFGWRDAKVVDGAIVGGRTTTEFRDFDLIVDLAEGGSLLLGSRRVEVGRGRSILGQSPRRGAPGTIGLADGAAAQRILLRPLGMTSIFNGKDESGWRRVNSPSAKKPPVWSVSNGVIGAVGGPGAFEYTGREFDDFVLQLDVRTRARRANGGVFFRNPPETCMMGYEAQIYNSCENDDPGVPSRYASGGIDDRQNARRLISRDGVTFRMTSVARGPHLSTWVNGYQVSDWTDDRALNETPRRGMRLAPGTIQLQAHDPMTDVEFQRIMIADLK